MRVTISDVRATGHCVLGIRQWFERHNIDFADFMRNGIEAEKLLATNDGLARRVVALVERREKGASGGR
jgi:hypothetical protein